MSVAEERNIEVKARIPLNPNEFDSRMRIARELTNSDGQLIEQKDVFFNAPNSPEGRFKLRYLKPPARSQLIYYLRPNVEGPKLSQFNKIEVDEPEVLEKMLAQSNGIQGILEKQRYLFLLGRTRIHLDKVTNLGNFIEFEVCLKPEDSLEEGQAEADKLMKLFNIKKEELMMGAYFDELKR